MRYAAILLGYCLALPAFAQDASTQSGPTQSGPDTATPRPVITEILGEVPTGQRVFSGMVDARYETSLAFRTGGRVSRIHVEAGDRVKQGDVIAELDQITLEQDLREARAAVGQAQAALDYAQASYDRAATLRKRGVLAQSDFETAEASLAAAKAQFDSAQAQERQSTQAAGYGKLTAPADGIVLSRAIEPGTLVSAGTEVVTFARGDDREAVIDMPQVLASTLERDQSFTVSHHSTDVPQIKAKLRLVEPVTNSSLDTMRAHLTLIAPSEDYRIGSLVSARLDTGNGEMLSIPKAALVAGTPPSVWVVSGTPRVLHRTTITTGTDYGSRIVVTQGLKSGDEVVLRGLDALQEGARAGQGLTLAGAPRTTTPTAQESTTK
ncbi:efflux RND transporter periplasmic adaptor subunit [Thioclava sp. GXIMD4215]|uniref:efflux RND transporter periplasmic adaptor subunit n=1 Tax=Thioclava sp. GXIMD4215 TaxID=3131928 RepID=UPI00324F632A